MSRLTHPPDNSQAIRYGSRKMWPDEVPTDDAFQDILQIGQFGDVGTAVAPALPTAAAVIMLTAPRWTPLFGPKSILNNTTVPTIATIKAAVTGTKALCACILSLHSLEPIPLRRISSNGKAGAIVRWDELEFRNLVPLVADVRGTSAGPRAGSAG